MPSSRFVVQTLLALVPASLGAQSVNGAAAEALRLRPGDAVRLEVRDEPALHADYPVDAEGVVLLPLIGLVRVANRPFSEVRAEVASAYARELADPVLRVMPVLRIAVLGEVTRPGLVPVDPTFSLADVVASAGGLTPSANRNAIHLVRGGVRVLTTSMEELSMVEAALLSGDQVFVDRRNWVQENVPILVGGGVSVLATLITALVLR